jgi:hypothetical protein
MALVKVNPQAVAKNFRAVLKELDKVLLERGEQQAIGRSVTNFGNYRFYPGKAVIGELAEANRYGTSNLDPLRDVLYTRMSDPRDIALEAVRTGRVGGKRISSNQRRQLAYATNQAQSEIESVENLVPYAIAARNAKDYSYDTRRNDISERMEEYYTKRSKIEKLLEKYFKSKDGYTNYYYNRFAGEREKRKFPAVARGIDIRYPLWVNADDATRELDRVIAAARNIPDKDRREAIIKDAIAKKALLSLKDNINYPDNINDAVRNAGDSWLFTGRRKRFKDLVNSIKELPDIGINQPSSFSYDDLMADRIARVRDIFEGLQDNPKAKEVALTLLDNWEGDTGELIEAAKLLS